MIQTIGHNAMRVTDMKKALEFYCEVLGLERAFAIQDDRGNPWIEYLKICDGAFLELFYGGNKDRDSAYQSDRIGYHHWCIAVGDISILAQKCFEKGLLPGSEPGLGRDSNQNIWIHDPDGNAVEIVQYNPNSPHMKTNVSPYDYDKKGLTGVAHIAFTVSNMEESMHYYCDILGFNLIYSLNDKEDNNWINYLRVCDGTYLELFYGGKERVKEKEDSAGFMHVCFICDDVFETVEEIRSKGAPIDDEPKQGKDLNTQAWSHDPDGNKVELMSIHPDSPQKNA